jgi:predicted small lipoprotein YifL
MFRWLVPTTAALVLAGCGLKGDLYLPPPPAPAPAPGAATAPTTPGDADATDRGERRQVPPAPAGDTAR